MKKGLIFITIIIFYVSLDYLFYQSLNHFYKPKNPYDEYYDSIYKKSNKNIGNYALIYLINSFAIFYLCVLKNPFIHPMLRYIHNFLVGLTVYAIHTIYLHHISKYPKNLILLDISFNSLAYPTIAFLALNLINRI